MNKKFVEYRLRTDANIETINGDKDLIDKVNTQAENNTGVWDERYGLENIGTLKNGEEDKLSFGGVIRASNANLCKGLLKEFKDVIKANFPSVKKIEEIFVASGDIV